MNPVIFAQETGGSRPVFQKGLAIGAGSLVVLLVFSTGIGYWHLLQLRENDAWVTHTNEVLDALGGVLSTMNDSETGQRGYLITGEDRYLEPYNAAVTAIQDTVQRLKHLTEDNPRQQARIPLLEERISAKLKELGRTIALRKKDPEAARQIVLTGEGKKFMDAIRALVQEMQQEERDLLVVRERQSRQSYLVAVLTRLITLVLSLGMVGMLLYLVQRHLSERQKAEEERARSAAEILRQKELLAVTLASIGDGVIVTDARGRVTFLNGEAEGLTGWTSGEAEGHPLPAVFHIINEHTRQAVEDPVEKVLRLGTVVGLANHTILVAKDGREIPIDDSGAPIRPSDGTVQGVVLVFRDFTQQKQAERSLARLAAIVESSNDAILSKDLNGIIQTWNAGADRLFGYRAEEVIGRPITLLLPPERIQEEEQILARVRNGQHVEHLETVRVTKDGRRIDVSVTVSPVKDQDGQIIGASKIVHDITDRKRAENALRQQAALLDLAHDAIIVRGEGDKVVFWSRGAEETYGWTPEEAMGQVTHDLLKTRFPKPLAEIAEDVAEKGRWEGELTHTRKDGQEIVVASRWAVQRDESGRQVGVLEINRDITERKRAEEGLRKAHDDLEMRVQERTADLMRTNAELGQAKQAAEAASRAKSTFLANMSHEIRTPLNAVIGMTELVLKSHLSVQQREYLVTVKDSGEALLSVINDILDFSKIEAGKLALDNTTFDLRESLGDTMKSFALRAHQRGLELTCFIHPEVPHVVVGDYNRLRQVVVNLVGNAVKFTDRGEVSLEVTQESCSQHDVVLHFTVSDTGIGIPEEKRSTIFEMFEQVDSSTTRRHGGTGLGLAIAAPLVTMMNGRIWLESEVGRGSCFHFTVRLTLGEEEPVEPVAPEPESLHGMRVLVVDDNATNRRILEEVLRSWKTLPSTVPNAWEAMTVIQQAQRAGEAYRLVVTDAHMPRIDGFMLAEQIKQDPAISSTVIMMLTSGDRPDDIARCNQLGIAAYLLKPVKQSELLEAIQLALGITVPREELLRSAAQQPHHVPCLHILLAEDSLVNQKLAVALLEGQGHTVTLASNGKEAVAATAAQPFDLVLMDLQMPEMDGLEAAAQIRAREQQTGTHLPIIAMTAHALKGDRERCMGAGMDNYVAKPIRAAELFQAIDVIFSDRKRVLATAVPPDVVNWTEALEMAQGNRMVLKSMAEAALEEAPPLMTAIRDAIANGDHAKLRFAAHTLRGALRYFGAKQVCEHAAELEDMGRKGEIVDAETIFAALEGKLARVTGVLSDYLRGI